MVVEAFVADIAAGAVLHFPLAKDLTGRAVVDHEFFLEFLLRLENLFEFVSYLLPAFLIQLTLQLLLELLYFLERAQVFPLHEFFLLQRLLGLGQVLRGDAGVSEKHSEGQDVVEHSEDLVHGVGADVDGVVDVHAVGELVEEEDESDREREGMELDCMGFVGCQHWGCHDGRIYGLL